LVNRIWILSIYFPGLQAGEVEYKNFPFDFPALRPENQKGNFENNGHLSPA
jgi:hypothetical protein